MRTAIDEEIVIKFVTRIAARDESCRVANIAEETAKRSLRIAFVFRNVRRALQADIGSEIGATILGYLAAGNVQVTKPEFNEHVGTEGMRVADGEIERLRRQFTAKAGQQ